MQPSKSLKYSAATHQGLHRDNNEDCYLNHPQYGLWMVADGMGGHAAGEVASAIVKDVLAQGAVRGDSLSESVQASHQAVLSAAEQGQGASGMGSTVVALQSNENHYQIAWVGDSRAYLWTWENNGGQLQQLTTDHSYVQMLVQSGAIAANESDSHPDKNIITQCIGSQELNKVKVDVLKGQWQKRQRILLCSDGLTDEVSDQKIADILCKTPDTDKAVDALIKAALSQGGHDNITVQVIESPYQPFIKRTVLPPITGLAFWDRSLYTAAIGCMAFIICWLLVL